GHRRAVYKLAGGVDLGSGVAVFIAPLPDAVKILERHAEGIHHAVASVAGWLGAVLAHQFADGEDLGAFFLFGEALHVRRRRRRWSAEEVFENVRAANHRRRSIG